MKHYVHLLTGAAALALMAGSAAAQTAQVAQAGAPTAGGATGAPTPGAAAPITGLDEIVVTAQRREQQLQNVPVAVTTLNEAMMERQGVTNLGALDRIVPNIVMNPNTGTSSASKIFLRGVGEDESFFTADTPVGIYIDDVYIARQTGSMFDLFDIERLEVLRGPQGTLYGRNTSAGAVKLISRKPDPGGAFANFDLTVGSYDLVSARASVNLPLGDKVAFQAAGLVKQRDGYTRNLFNNAKVNDQDVRGVRLSLLAEPTERLSLLLTGDAIRESSTPGYAVPLVVDRTGPIPRATDIPKTGDYFQTRSDIQDPANDIAQNGVALTASYDLTDDLELKSVSALRELSNFLYLDADGDVLAPPPPATNPSRFHLFQDQIQWQASQELQVNGAAMDDRLSFVAGAFYFFEWNDQQTKSVIGLPALSALPIAFAGRFDLTPTAEETLKTTSIAGFGSASYEVTDQLSVTVGLRWTEETKRYTNYVLLPNGQQQAVCLNAARTGTLGALPCTPAQLALGGLTFLNGSGFEQTWSDWTPRFVVDYQWTPDILTYVSAAKGFKGGTTSGRTTAAAENFNRLIGDPETNWSYELGVKADWLDNRLRTNVAVFQNDYKGLQYGVSLPSGGFGRINAGEARIRGAELEATAVPLEGLELFGSLGYLDGEYKEFTAALTTCAAQGLTTREQLLDLDLKQTPEWSYRVGFDYSYSLGSSGAVSFGSDFSKKTKHYNNLCNSEGIAVEDYEILNAQARWESENGNWLVTLAGTNLLDQEIFNGGFDFAASLGFAAAYMYPPRMVSLSLRYRI